MPRWLLLGVLLGCANERNGLYRCTDGAIADFCADADASPEASEDAATFVAPDASDAAADTAVDGPDAE